MQARTSSPSASSLMSPRRPRRAPPHHLRPLAPACRPPPVAWSPLTARPPRYVRLALSLPGRASSSQAVVTFVPPVGPNFKARAPAEVCPKRTPFTRSAVLGAETGSILTRRGSPAPCCRLLCRAGPPTILTRSPNAAGCSSTRATPAGSGAMRSAQDSRHVPDAPLLQKRMGYAGTDSLSFCGNLTAVCSFPGFGARAVHLRLVGIPERAPSARRSAHQRRLRLFRHTVSKVEGAGS